VVRAFRRLATRDKERVAGARVNSRRPEHQNLSPIQRLTNHHQEIAFKAANNTITMSDTEEIPEESQIESPPSGVFVPPSVHKDTILTGQSYTHHSPLPPTITPNSTPCILGVDEAGRGPVLGPMVYAVAYAPLDVCDTTLKSYAFDDSKKLTAAFRNELISEICDEEHELGKMVGWAVRVMSPQGISSGMLRNRGMGAYNLNAQAHDTTIQLIKEVIAMGVVVKEVKHCFPFFSSLFLL
jgi:ribonuclease H2 subunit A